MGSRTTLTSKMDLFKTIFDSFYYLAIVGKSSILDVADADDPTLMAGIFALQKWINQFEANFPFI